MKRFYKSPITKVPVGSAVEYKEVPLHGNIIIRVSDYTTSGSYKIFAIDCDDSQNEVNLAMLGVVELSEDDAVKLAAEYQPERTVTQFNPKTRKEEKITIPVFELKS